MYVLRYVTKKIWNSLYEEMRQNYFKGNQLLKTGFESLLDEGPISMREIKLVFLLWVYFVQHKCFEDVFIALKNKKKT